MPTRSKADSRENQTINLEGLNKIKSKNKKNRLIKLVTEIIGRYNPEMVYLFGSYARGSNKMHSVIDILIIGETDLRFIQRIKEILHLSRGKITISPLFYTSDEFELLKKNNDGFIASVLDDAKILYKKAVR